jgi:hypothetical protein
MRIGHSSEEERLWVVKDHEAEEPFPGARRRFRELDPIRISVWSGIGLAAIVFWSFLAWWLFAYV